MRRFFQWWLDYYSFNFTFLIIPHQRLCPAALSIIFITKHLLSFFSVWVLSVVRGHCFFSSLPQRPMTSDFEGFLYQILSITLFYFLNYIINFIYFTTITKHHARWHRCLRLDGLRCGRKPECPEETHLSDLVTTWPSHMQRWEASALTLRQPNSYAKHLIERIASKF